MKSLLIFLVLAIAQHTTPVAAKASDLPKEWTTPIAISVVPKENVRDFILSRFRTSVIRDAATKPASDNAIAALIQQAARFPLFTYMPNSHPAARLNFTAYLRLLSLRDDAYTDPLFGDLYLLHELHHITTMPYDPELSFRDWQEKMTLNEKESTLFSEALVHFAIPELREKFSIPTIWADRFLTAEMREEYFANPRKVQQIMLARFTSIAYTKYDSLDPVERRSWVFDRSNELWSAIYWKVAPDIEAHMKSFYTEAGKDPFLAAKQHSAWLLANTKNGLPFHDQDVEFNDVYAKINAEIPKLSAEQVYAYGKKIVAEKLCEKYLK